MPTVNEIETKFVVSSFEPIRKTLLALGATRLSRHFETNVVLDGPEAALRREGRLLRLRRDAVSKVTLKLPAAVPDSGGIKIRQEIETEIADLSALEAIFAHLGYGPMLRYEKVRETWRAGSLLICFDTLPFGTFLELEGPADVIAAMAGNMGMSMEQASAQTYHDLYQVYLREKGLPPADSFVFTPEKRAGLLAELAATETNDTADEPEPVHE